MIWNFLFFLFSYLSLVVSLSLCSLPFFSFPSSCYFSLVSINPFHLYAAFGELHTQTLFFFLCYSQLIWTGTFRFDKKSNPTLIILTYFPFCLPPFFFSVYGFGRLFKQSLSFFRQVLSRDPPKHSKSLCGVEHASLPPFTTNCLFIHSFILFG